MQWPALRYSLPLLKQHMDFCVRPVFVQDYTSIRGSQPYWFLSTSRACPAASTLDIHLQHLVKHGIHLVTPPMQHLPPAREVLAYKRNSTDSLPLNLQHPTSTFLQLRLNLYFSFVHPQALFKEPNLLSTAARLLTELLYVSLSPNTCSVC